MKTPLAKAIREHLSDMTPSSSPLHIVTHGGERIRITRRYGGWSVSYRSQYMDGRMLLVTDGAEMDLVLTDPDSPVRFRLSILTGSVRRVVTCDPKGATATVWEASR